MDQSQVQGQATGTVVNTVVENVVPNVTHQDVQSVHQVNVVDQVVSFEQPILINQSDGNKPVETKIKAKKDKGPVATSFVVFLFQFIVLGISSFFKH